MKSIGYGAYDGFASLDGFNGLNGFGSTSGCGEVGELCKDNVKKEDIDELIERVKDHRECALAPKGVPCSFKYPLRKTIEKTITLIERLVRDGNRQAATMMSSALDEMGQLMGLPSGGYNRLAAAGVDTMLDASMEPWQEAEYKKLPWTEIAKYMHWDNPNRGESGGALHFLLRAKDAVYFMRRITPEDDQRRANVIIQLIEAGKQDASKLATASNALKKAWITDATRDQLQEQLNAAYKTAKIKNPDQSTAALVGSALATVYTNPLKWMGLMSEDEQSIYEEAGAQAVTDVAAGDPLRSKREQGMSWEEIYDPSTITYATTGSEEAAREMGKKRAGEACYLFDIKCQYKKNKMTVWLLVAGIVAVVLLVVFTYGAGAGVARAIIS